MSICAYTAVCEPVTGRLPIHQCVQALYDHIDEFVVLDVSRYDNIDLSMYGKVKKHIRSLLNPFDNPFGSIFSQALRMANTDLVLFLDSDELFQFKTSSLADLIKRYTLKPGVGIAFSLRNYYGSRHFLLDACSTKGMHVFQNSDNLYHDLLAGFWEHKSSIRRTNLRMDFNDGVRLGDEQGRPTAHYQPVPQEEVVIHHTSHLDLAGKMVRSIVQFNHYLTIDFPGIQPYDMRLRPELINKIYAAYNKDIDKGLVQLYGDPIPHDYVPFKLLDDYIEYYGIREIDPSILKQVVV
jgi:hypothetical protein